MGENIEYEVLNIELELDGGGGRSTVMVHNEAKLEEIDEG